MISTDSAISENSTTASDQPAWDDSLLANPHAVADKRSRVQRMFAAIAPSYDVNNRVHSLWIDEYWRRKTVQLAQLAPADCVVDVACGTGDLTLKFAQAVCDATNSGTGSRCTIVPSRDRVLGIDFTYEMLPLARAKASARPMRGCRGFFLSNHTQFTCGDAMSLPLADTSTDVISIAFGIRNVADPAAAIREFFRVLCPGGRLLILEFSLPTNRVLRGLYNFYFRKILPRTATLISGDKTGAYKYLPESVNTFIGREQMMQMMRDAGFIEVTQHPMTFGVSVCYRGERPA